MQLGSVFVWNNFPFGEEGKVKNRYFVYFGESHYPDNNPIKVFLITTTSRIYHYEEEGARKNHNYYRFKAGSFGFVEESILDVDSYYDINKESLEKNKEYIEEKGHLPEHILKDIYNLILQSKNISIKVKHDIHDSYNCAGITGLKRPKRK